MFTQFITLTTNADDKTWVVAIPVNNIALMEERTNHTIITLVNGGKVVVNEMIEEILSKIEEDDDDDDDWNDEEEE